MTSSQLKNASESINITFPVVFTSKQIHEICLYFTDDLNYEEIVSCFSAALLGLKVWCRIQENWIHESINKTTFSTAV